MNKKDRAKKCGNAKRQDLFPFIEIQPERFLTFTVGKEKKQEIPV